MSKNIVISFTAVLFIFLLIGTILHHDPLSNESMTTADTQCCAIALSGMNVLAKGYTALVFFTATIFVLAVSLPTPSNINTRLYHPPKR